MIEDLRFVEREIAYIDREDTKLKTLRILQAFDGHVWFDVPLVKPEQND